MKGLFSGRQPLNYVYPVLRGLEALMSKFMGIRDGKSSFILTDHKKAIEELFEVGKEIITYKDKNEIPDLIRFYLNHQEERERIALKGRERVLKEHTYKRRLETILSSMRRKYG